jgi:tRNA modification GTPase
MPESTTNLAERDDCDAEASLSGLIVCQMTANGRGAIAVVALHGQDAQRILAKFFQPATSTPDGRLPVGRIRYGRWVPSESPTRGHESVVCIARQPNLLEIHCHGGRAAVAAIVDDLRNAGAELVTQFAFLKRMGAGDQAAEMQHILAHTNTPTTAAIMLHQLRGGLLRWAQSALQRLQHSASTAESEVRTEVERILSFRKAGQHLVTSLRVVLAGPPNVGKSSLLNAILGYERSITYATPGTTRDVIEATTAIEGWSVRIGDTAGIREASGTIESEGIRRAVASLSGCDLVLSIVDASVGLVAEHDRIRSVAAGPVMQVWNKVDLLDTEETSTASRGSRVRPGGGSVTDNATSERMEVSAKDGRGIDHLVAEMLSRILPHRPDREDIVPCTEVQFKILTACQRSRDADTLAAALSELITRMTA